MNADAVERGSWWVRALRAAAWGGAAFLLLLPLVAMQFTPEVRWGPIDFAVMGALLFGCAAIVDRATRVSQNIAYLAGVVVAVGASFLLIWSNLAVGLIGDEDNPANLLFAGVILIAAAGSAIAGFKPKGMAIALFAAALAQTVIAVAGFSLGWGASEPPGPVGLIALNGFFVALWVLSGALFGAAGRSETRRIP